MKKFLLLPACIILAACGTAPKDVSNGKPFKPKDQPQKGVCSTITDLQEFSIQFTAPLPERLAVDLVGERGPVRKFDECKRAADQPPLTVLRRGPDNTLVLTIEHWGAYPTLPRDTTFTIYDLEKCEARSEPKVLFAANRQVVDFHAEYPNGANCPARQAARISLLKP